MEMMEVNLQEKIPPLAKYPSGGDFMADNGDFLAGIVIGGLLGFIAGILLAPAPGSETRELIAEKTQTAVKETRENVESVSEAVKDNVTRVAGFVKDKLPECSCCEADQAGNGAEPA